MRRQCPEPAVGQCQEHVTMTAEPPQSRPRPGRRPVTRQPDDSDPSRRPPDYVIVVAAGDWLKRRFPAAAASLTDALHAGQNRHREPDLEAEP